MPAISPSGEADHPGGSPNPSHSLTPPISILPRIQQIDARGGKVDLVASNDGEAALECRGGNQTIDGRDVSRPGHEAAPLIRDARIDRQNTALEPVRQFRLEPNDDPPATAAVVQPFDPLANFAQRQNADEQRIRRCRVEPIAYPVRRPGLDQLRKCARVDQETHSVTSRGGDRSRSMSNSTPASGDARRNSTSEGFGRLRRS